MIRPLNLTIVFGFHGGNPGIACIFSWWLWKSTHNVRIYLPSFLLHLKQKGKHAEIYSRNPFLAHLYMKCLISFGITRTHTPHSCTHVKQNYESSLSAYNILLALVLQSDSLYPHLRFLSILLKLSSGMWLSWEGAWREPWVLAPAAWKQDRAIPGLRR